MRKFIYYFTVMIFLLFARSAQAMLVLDQEHAPAGNFAALTVANDRSQIQTFTAGVTGYLSQIDVQVGRNSDTFEDILLSIWSTNSSGFPLNQLLLGSAPASSSNEGLPRPFVTFNFFSNPLFISEGDLLALVLDSDALNEGPTFSERYVWEIGEDYNRGVAFTRMNALFFEQDGDFHFRTYTSVIPEPATIFLFGSGMLGSFVRRRRRWGIGGNSLF